ncbi:hypothetical protein PTR67_10325 [Serratia nevei]|uniref:hypothetical protein n=1 Tax=Serratia TaxID=613 RepID=UPI002DBC51FD|nr:hypothetical protein [Serratia marcescens]MEB6081505.1 hypothetical protein [Serratia marcescens]
MSEWFDNNASAIIAAASALLAAIIAAGSALWGSWLNNKSSKDQRENQFEVEKWKANRELYIDRSEEVFSLFNKWNANAHQVMMLHFCRLVGSKSADVVNKEWEQYKDGTLQPRIDTLISMYFPELIDDFDKITKLFSTSIGKYGLFVIGNIETTEYATFINNTTDEISFLSEKFKLKLAMSAQKHL